MASLVDTNVLVYSFDPRDEVKQRRANEILRDGLLADSVVLAHQCIVEFVAAVNGVAEICSEDFEHGRHYGRVRVVNPFLPADGVHDLPALYDVENRAHRGKRLSRSGV